MRQFRLDSATAAEFAQIDKGIWYCRHLTYNQQSRLRRLLLHWWAVGHDPRRALNRCEDCHWEGQGFQMKTTGGYDSLDYPVECETCKGTGRADVEFGGWRKL